MKFKHRFIEGNNQLTHVKGPLDILNKGYYKSNLIYKCNEKKYESNLKICYIKSFEVLLVMEIIRARNQSQKTQNTPCLEIRGGLCIFIDGK